MLTIIALGLGAFSITQAKVSIGYYGLLESFPVTFYVSLGFLTIASAILWGSKESHSKLLLFQVFLLIFALWLLPLLIGGAQPAPEHIRVKFFDFGYVPQLALGGYLTPSAVYLNWPSLFILVAGVVDILGITDLEPAFILAPFMLQIAFALVLYPFLKNLLGSEKTNYCWAGIWIFILANWGENNYLGSQPYGLLLLLFILFLFIKISTQPLGSTSIGYRISIILLFSALIITHLLTFLVGLAMIIVLTLLFRKRMSFNLVMIAIIIGVIWTIYQTTSIFNYYLPKYVDNAFNIWIILGDIFGTAGETGGIIGSASHQAVALIRILTSALFVIIVFIGFVMGRRSKKSISLDNAFIAIGLGAVLGGVSGLYSQEIVQRTWYFMLPVIVYFSIKLLDRRVTAALLSLLLLAVIPLHFISHYGNQASDYRSPSHIAGYAFRDSIIKNSPRAEGMFRQLSLEGNELVFSPGGLWGIFPTGDHYFPVSKRMDDYYEFQRDEPEFVDKFWAWAQNGNFYDSVYTNPEYNLYIHYGLRLTEDGSSLLESINIAEPSQ